MRKWIVLLMAAMLLMLGANALAANELRHEIFGDVSTFEVGKELDQAEMNDEKTEAKLGTDVYLFVDPDTASYVTFHVTDDSGEILEEAFVYVSYNGIEELLGVTDEHGNLSTYLFRNVEYGYRVEKWGYETAHGRFTATEETKWIHVVLREPQTLTVIVYMDGKPLRGAIVNMDGWRVTTGSDGKASGIFFNGPVPVTVTAPDGQRQGRVVMVAGNTTVYFYFYSGAGGLLADEIPQFLVYDKNYDPEDYVLTEYSFAELDLTRKAGETDEAFAQRAAAYLAENVNTVAIAAQPDRIQHAEGVPDEDVVDAYGVPVYGQRSLMPMGALWRAWEDEGFEQLAFTNEDMGLLLPMASLHSGEAMRAWAVLHAMRGGDVPGVTQEMLSQVRAGATLSGVDLSAIGEYVFNFDAQTSDTAELLPDALFDGTTIEVRITPILEEAIRAAILGGLKEQLPAETIELGSAGQMNETLRRFLAEGKITAEECEALSGVIIDGRLAQEEIAELRALAAEGKLGDAAIDALVWEVLAGRMYRVGFYLWSGGEAIDVTAQLSGMAYLYAADGLHAQAEDEAELLARYDALVIAGGEAERREAALLRSIPEDEEMAKVVMRKMFAQRTVDVRTTGRTTAPTHESYTTPGVTKMQMHRALSAPCTASGVTAVSEK